jgi:5-deoxy-D-glucuronate isomerase
MEKITKESKRCFSHGFTVLEETKSKLLLLAVLATAMAPPRETADFFPPPPEEEDWHEHPEMGNIEEEIHYLRIHPNKGFGKKE